MTQEKVHLVSLTAKNFKILRYIAVQFPHNGVQTITGRNRQGKSAALGAIWAALGGKDASKAVDNPIRDGENEASTMLDLGSLTVTRKWTRTKNGEAESTLDVRNAAGIKQGTPQSLLDTMRGTLAFDPMEFVGMSPKAQADLLLKATGQANALANIEISIQVAFEERKNVNRRAKELEGALASVPDSPLPIGTSKDDPKELSSAELVAAMTAIHAHNQQVENAESNKRSIEAAIKRQSTVVEDLASKLDGARKELTRMESELQSVVIADRKDTAEIETKLRTIDADNATIRKHIERIKLAKNLAECAAKSDELTTKIETLRDQSSALIANAKLPVNGLSIKDGAVLYNGQTMNDISTSDSINVGFGLALAMNPTLRLCMIRRGSELDKVSMQAIHALCVEHDILAIIERVEDDNESAIVIEDGEVKGHE